MIHIRLTRFSSGGLLFLALASLLVAGCGDLANESAVPLATFTVGTEAPPPEGDPMCASSADEHCCEACLAVHECRPAVSVEECEDRCMRSKLAASHGVRCLALRVFWIDEEHCPRIGPTWDNFDDDDDCTGPPPDEEGYGPF